LDGALSRAHARAREKVALGRGLRHHRCVSDQPRCTAVLRSGEHCRSVVATDSEFCAPHNMLAAKYGDAALRIGKYPKRRRDSTLVRVIDGEKGVTAEVPKLN
jgi:hypothetical protein